MGRGKGLIRWWCLVMLTLLLMHGAMSSKERSRACAPSRCGIITNISRPFRLPDDPPNCGDSAYELACENNVTLLHLSSNNFPEINYTYHVLGINYNNFTIRLVDPGIQQGNCSSLPRSVLSPSYLHDYYYNMWYPYGGPLTTSSFQPVLYLNCSDAVRDDAEYVDTAPCVNWESKGGGHIYAVVGDLAVGKTKPECHVESVATITSEWGSFLKGGNLSYADIHRVLSYGFEVSWWRQACADLHCSPDQSCSFNPHTQNVQCNKFEDCYDPLGIKIRCGDGGKLSKLRIFAEAYLLGIYIGLRQIRGETILDFNGYNATQPPYALGVGTGRFVLPFITARFLVGMACLFALLIYTCRRRHLSIYENVEDFLQLQNLIPIRYSYKELKKMTKGFKNKLGEGGFGTVYKGKLSSGLDVAIKMLGKSKANGQEFISEVATIGRI